MSTISFDCRYLSVSLVCHPHQLHDPWKTFKICFIFFNFYFVLGDSQLAMLWQFQVNSEGTQPYICMYPFSSTVQALSPPVFHPPGLLMAWLCHNRIDLRIDNLVLPSPTASYPRVSILRGKSLRDRKWKPSVSKIPRQWSGSITSSVFPYSKHTLTFKGRNHAPQPFKGRGPKNLIYHTLCSMAHAQII